MDDNQAERLETCGGPGLAGEAAIVIDPRLADLWGLVWSLDAESDGAGELAPGTVAALLRLAYVQGYVDAHSERRPGSLYRELGLRSATSGSRPSSRRSRRGRVVPGSSGK